MVEQRPFKALVLGSSPSQPTRPKKSVNPDKYRKMANYSPKAIANGGARKRPKAPKSASHPVRIWQVVNRSAIVSGFSKTKMKFVELDLRAVPKHLLRRDAKQAGEDLNSFISRVLTEGIRSSNSALTKTCFPRGASQEQFPPRSWFAHAITQEFSKPYPKPPY
jgi:hypothetical protein